MQDAPCDPRSSIFDMPPEDAHRHAQAVACGLHALTADDVRHIHDARDDVRSACADDVDAGLVSERDVIGLVLERLTADLEPVGRLGYGACGHAAVAAAFLGLHFLRSECVAAGFAPAWQPRQHIETVIECVMRATSAWQHAALPMVREYREPQGAREHALYRLHLYATRAEPLSTRTATAQMRAIGKHAQRKGRFVGSHPQDVADEVMSALYARARADGAPDGLLRRRAPHRVVFDEWRARDALCRGTEDEAAVARLPASVLRTDGTPWNLPIREFGAPGPKAAIQRAASLDVPVSDENAATLASCVSLGTGEDGALSAVEALDAAKVLREVHAERVLRNVGRGARVKGIATKYVLLIADGMMTQKDVAQIEGVSESRLSEALKKEWVAIRADPRMRALTQGA